MFLPKIFGKLKNPENFEKITLGHPYVF